MKYLSKKNCKLYIVGGTKYYIKLLKKYIEEAKVYEYVELVGYIPQEEVVEYLAGSDILVLPNTKQDLYTSPLKLFEYAAVRRPIVAAGLPCIKELLSENEAVLFKPEDVNSLTSAIIKLINNKHLQEKLAENAYNKLKNYTWENRAKKIINFIKGINP
jgi:glycosyltransferase involved in cell wall biosynthesis